MLEATGASEGTCRCQSSMQLTLQWHLAPHAIARTYRTVKVSVLMVSATETDMLRTDDCADDIVSELTSPLHLPGPMLASCP